MSFPGAVPPQGPETCTEMGDIADLGERQAADPGERQAHKGFDWGRRQCAVVKAIRCMNVVGPGISVDLGDRPRTHCMGSPSHRGPTQRMPASAKAPSPLHNHTWAYVVRMSGCSRPACAIHRRMSHAMPDLASHSPPAARGALDRSVRRYTRPLLGRRRAHGARCMSLVELAMRFLRGVGARAAVETADGWRAGVPQPLRSPRRAATSVHVAHFPVSRETLGQRASLHEGILVALIRAAEQEIMFTRPPEGDGSKPKYRSLRHKDIGMRGCASAAAEFFSCRPQVSASGRAMSHHAALCAMSRTPATVGSAHRRFCAWALFWRALAP